MDARGMISTGLDRLLDDASRLKGRRFGLLAHGASLSRLLVPAHVALADAGFGAARLFGPEHGFYGVEQDMVAARDQTDPLTDTPVVSLYGDDAESLRPRTEAFADLDLVLIDLQDIGTRYYTYAATAVWTAEAALAAGVEVWILDRPNPLGGEVVEGNLPEPGFESFVGAFRLPVRHGLTLGEMARLELRRRGSDEAGLTIVTVAGWKRSMMWPALGRPWIAPSPNMPDFDTALLYPGMCLLEATEISEGRGTTRPFRLFGAPGIDPLELAHALTCLREHGVAVVPSFFRPWHQKHRGEVCGGAELGGLRSGKGLRFSDRGRSPGGFALPGVRAVSLARGRLRIRHRPPGCRSAGGVHSAALGDRGRRRPGRMGALMGGRRGLFPGGETGPSSLFRGVRVKIPALVGVNAPAAAFDALFAAAHRRGVRIGWLELETAPSPPPELALAADAGAFKSVAVGGQRALSLKPVRGPVVLRDLLREHFLGCGVVLVRGDARYPRLSLADGSYRLAFSVDRERSLDADEAVAVLLRPRHRARVPR